MPGRGPVPALFERRLLVVAGKGGVGKTTVACTLGTLAARQGKRTLIAEVDGAGRAAELLGVIPAELGRPRDVDSNLAVMSIEGSAALEEYLQIIMPMKRLLRAVFRSQIYRYFVAAAPGLKELMTIGKIWYEAERVDPSSGGRQWDLVILDAPATGHGLQYLGMPKAAHEVFRAGMVGSESQRLIDLLTDPQRCAVNLVTTAEEMPYNETLEMYDRLRGSLAMPLGCLFVNRIHPGDIEEEDIVRLERAIEAAPEERRACLVEVLERAREARGWAALNQSYLDRLAVEVPLPRIEIPFLYTRTFAQPEIETIAGHVAHARGRANPDG